MANTIKVTDADRVSYRVRIVVEGRVEATVYIEDYDLAVDWGYAELQRLPGQIRAAVVEEGLRFEPWDPGMGCIIFVPNGNLRDGLVLNKELLTTVSRDFLFGLK